jgi:hypothetical protein
MGYPQKTPKKHNVPALTNFKYAVKVLLCRSFAVLNYVFFHWYSISINYVHQVTQSV